MQLRGQAPLGRELAFEPWDVPHRKPLREALKETSFSLVEH
jgi:hypothetical protein